MQHTFLERRPSLLDIPSQSCRRSLLGIGRPFLGSQYIFVDRVSSVAFRLGFWSSEARNSFRNICCPFAKRLGSDYMTCRCHLLPCARVRDSELETRPVFAPHYSHVLIAICRWITHFADSGTRLWLEACALASNRVHGQSRYFMLKRYNRGWSLRQLRAIVVNWWIENYDFFVYG